MDEPLTAPVPPPEPARERRWPAAVASFLTAILLNALILASLLLVRVNETRKTPPGIVAAVVPADPAPPVDPPEPDRPQPSVQSGGAPAALDLAIVTSTTSALSLTLPDLPSFDDGISGLAGIGSSFGSGFGSGTAGTGGASMKVGKITVKAKQLGLILDVSGSMEEELPKVKREVRKAFKDAKAVEVKGCRVDWTEPADADGEKRSEVKLRSDAASVVEAVEMLVVAGRVDALYWFSDLQDGETEAGLARLRELLHLERGRGRAVKFYIRSLGKEPSPELAAIVRDSGGAVQAGEKGE